MPWTDNVSIETPEQIELSLEPAGLGSRFVGKVVDVVIRLILVLLAWPVSALILPRFGIPAPEFGQFLLWALFFYLFLQLVYDVGFELGKNGQSPGKRLAAIRLIRAGGAPLTFLGSCIRKCLRISDILPAFYILGGIMVLLTPPRPRLGDLAARPMVIR